MIGKTVVLTALYILVLNCRMSGQQQNNWLISIQKFTQEQGLPSSEVNAVVQDTRGYLWVGTRSGLCRFDGYKFERIMPLADSLRHYRIEQLVSDNRHSVIVSYFLPAYRLKPRIRVVVDINTLEQTPFADAYPQMPFIDTNIVCLQNTKDGNLSFLTVHPNAFYHYEPVKGFKQLYTKNQTLSNWKYITQNMSFLKEQEGVLYGGCYSWRAFVASDTGLVYTQGNNFMICGGRPQGCLVYHVDSIKRVPDRFFLMDKVGKLQPFKLFDSLGITKGNFHLYNSKTCGNGSAIILQFNNSKDYFLSETYELIELNENNLREGLGVLNSFIKDKSCNYWLCTSKGLIKLNITKRLFTNHFSQPGSIPGSNRSVRGIYAAEDTMCINFFDGIYRRNGKDTLFIPIKNNYALYKTDTGYWNGSFELRYIDGHKKRFQRISQSELNEIWSIYKLSDYQLLLGCTSGMTLFNLKDGTHHLIKSPYPSPYFVYKIFKARDGLIFAIATNGIFVFNLQGEIINYFGKHQVKSSHRLPDFIINDVFIDDHEVFWIATGDDGLCRWDRALSSFTYYNRSNGLLSDQIYCIQQDEFKNLWLSTEYGIAKLNPTTGFIRTYTDQDGISENEFNRGSQFKSRDGRIYFGGVSGFVSFHPQDFYQDTSSVDYNFEISRFNAFNSKTGLTQNLTGSVIQDKVFKVEPWITYFSIEFSLLEFVSVLNHYAYKIEGLDKDWNYLTENSLRLSNLPYGTYNLLIKAQTANGYWNKKQINIQLIVVPPFYKTWWFIVLVALLVAALYAFILWIRFRQRVKQIKQISELRLKLASNLHDEVGGLLHKSAMQSEMLKARVDAVHGDLLDKISNNCRQAMQSMRDIMWNLDSRNDKLEQLEDRMKEYALAILQDRFNYHFEVEVKNDLPIEPEKRQALLLIFKESLNNILKHAEFGTLVHIKLWADLNSVYLKVHSASPYKPSASKIGQGTKNMMMRAQGVAAKLSIVTDNGVEIYLEMPL